jgi:putative restriction endonuclease
MSFGVFIHRADSIYEDTPAERYQFPVQYLARVQACIGDWVIYYEPSKVTNTKGYFAVAKVGQVVSDPTSPGMYLAMIEAGSYLDFPSPVPFKDELGSPAEAGLNGRGQWAVRPLSPRDFNHIVQLGLGDNAPLLPRVDDSTPIAAVQDDRMSFGFDSERERVRVLTSRTLRDPAFRRLILNAYDERCALTGLKLINGGGRAEVEAAHIKPIEAKGPDSVSNGIALSGTAHWMFDRGLVSLTDDLQILVSRQVNDPESIRSVLNKAGYALLPRRLSDRPHPHFLQWHREHCFKH